MVNRRSLFKQGAGAAAAVGIGNGLVTGRTQTDGLGSGDPKHVVLLVLDRSGSMNGLQAAVTKSINDFLDEQQANVGMHIGIVQFDDNKTAEGGYCEPIFSFTAANSTPRLGPNDYQPRGGTPLLAAVAEAISKLEKVIRPIDRALMVFQTDGYENSSPREITKTVIKNLIAAKTAEGNWTFAFLGADIDAWGEGGSLGVAAGSTMTYANTFSGTQTAYATTSNSATRWYGGTGGGMSTADASIAPSNTNANFYSPTVTPTVTPTVIPPDYDGVKPWAKLTALQQAKWLSKHNRPTSA